jgi:DNA (cytosine-5)-methyltransferase 1
MKVGSLFSGLGGLDLAVCASFGASLAWYSEIDPGPCGILAQRFPEIPNLGDITEVSWDEVEPVDIICGGFPCTDVSYAGLRKGMDDTRSGLWSYMAEAVCQVGPKWVVVENVAGLFTPIKVEDQGDVQGYLPAPIEKVLRDLAQAGFDAEWSVLRASDVGAPHRRERIFILAKNTKSEPGSLFDREPERTDAYTSVPRPQGQEPTGRRFVPTRSVGAPPPNSLCQPVRNGSRGVGDATSSPESREEER